GYPIRRSLPMAQSWTRCGPLRNPIWPTFFTGAAFAQVRGRKKLLGSPALPVFHGAGRRGPRARSTAGRLGGPISTPDRQSPTDRLCVRSRPPSVRPRGWCAGHAPYACARTPTTRPNTRHTAQHSTRTTHSTPRTTRTHTSSAPCTAHHSTCATVRPTTAHVHGERER